MTEREAVLAFLRSTPAWSTIDQIAAATDLPRRTIEETIQALRLEGTPIATSSTGAARGVKLAQTAAELASSNATLRHRLKVQYATLRAQQHAEAALRQAEAPKPLWPAWERP